MSKRYVELSDVLDIVAEATAKSVSESYKAKDKDDEKILRATGEALFRLGADISFRVKKQNVVAVSDVVDIITHIFGHAIDDNNIGYDELAFLVTHWNELKTKIFEEEDDE